MKNKSIKLLFTVALFFILAQCCKPITLHPATSVATLLESPHTYVSYNNPEFAIIFQVVGSKATEVYLIDIEKNEVFTPKVDLNTFVPTATSLVLDPKVLDQSKATILIVNMVIKNKTINFKINGRKAGEKKKDEVIADVTTLSLYKEEVELILN